MMGFAALHPSCDYQRLTLQMVGFNHRRAKLDLGQRSKVDQQVLCRSGGLACATEKPMKLATRSALAASAFACTALLSFGWSEQGGIALSIESAQARVGRPLTPVSVAGVARRQTRRAAYGYGAGVVGAGLAGAAVVGTAAAVAAAPYYGGTGYYSGGPYYRGAGYAGGPYAAYGYPVQDYATRNGFVCQPGTMTRLDDGRMYPCQ